MAAFDVIIAGLGAMGSSTAYQLSARGKRVLGLEQYTAAHDRGSTHGKSRITCLSLYEHPAYIALLRRANELWKQIERDSGRRLFTSTGFLTVGRPGSSFVKMAIRSSREFDLPHRILDATEIKRRFPPFAPDADAIGVYDETGAVLYPEDAIRAYLDHAARLGAELHFEEPVLRWEVSPGGNGARVITARGGYEAARLIITPGPWALHSFTKLELPLAVERYVMYWFEAESRIEQFLPDRFPTYVCVPENELERFYGFPALDGPNGGVKVAFSRGGIPCSPDTIERHVDEDEIELMRGRLAQWIPPLAGTCITAKTCMYTNTPDFNFIVGIHPLHPQTIIAAGFSGHGFKFASVMGEILADLATEGSTRHPIDLFAPGRRYEPTPLSPR
jgi:sarcosine oxidase